MRSRDSNVPLNEYITLQRGFDLPIHDRINGTVPVVASTGIVGFHDEAKVVGPGVVIGRSGSIGGGQFIKEDFWPLNTTLWVKDFKGHNPRFIYYLLKNIDFSSLNVGSGVPTLNRNHLSSIEVINFDEDEEIIIAGILGNIDDKIDLNRQINQTLEQIAQAIFKSWFIDFDPVKAKIKAKEKGEDPERAAMCVISGKSEEELEQLPSDQLEQLSKTAALFPDELEESTLGMIPKGWGISTIGKEFRVIMGQSPPGQTYNETGDGIIFFQGRRDFGWRYPSNRVYCSAPTRFAKAGDTLLSVRAPVGDINKAKSDCCIGRGLASLRHNSGCEAYTYYSIQRLEKNFKNFDKEGTVFGSINQNDLKTIKIIKPDASILSLFSIIVGNLDKQICLLEDQNSNLSALRDSLLPKLLSGEIQIN